MKCPRSIERAGNGVNNSLRFSYSRKSRRVDAVEVRNDYQFYRAKDVRRRWTTPSPAVQTYDKPHVGAPVPEFLKNLPRRLRIASVRACHGQIRTTSEEFGREFPYAVNHCGARFAIDILRVSWLVGRSSHRLRGANRSFLKAPTAGAFGSHAS